MLEVNNLTKVYDRLVAVQDVSFTLEPGDVFGFIGSNGAGKTTTIKMLATLLEPTSGTATLDGFDIQRDQMEVRRRLGYMPDFFGLYDDIRVWEYLDFFASLYNIPKSQRRETIDNVLELTDLMFKRDAFVQSLSRGMQQRLCLAHALVHDPTLLLLDEPASGLDPRARAEFKELVAELGRMGKIVLVSSHILPELTAFCNKVGIIERGRMLTFGNVHDVVRSSRPHKLIIVRVLGDAYKALGDIREKPGVLQVAVADDGTIRMDFEGTLEQQADVLQALMQGGHRPIDFREEHADLEDVFLKVTTGALN